MASKNIQIVQETGKKVTKRATSRVAKEKAKCEKIQEISKKTLSLIQELKTAQPTTRMQIVQEQLLHDNVQP